MGSPCSLCFPLPLLLLNLAETRVFLPDFAYKECWRGHAPRKHRAIARLLFFYFPNDGSPFSDKLITGRVPSRRDPAGLIMDKWIKGYDAVSCREVVEAGAARGDRFMPMTMP